MIVLLYSSSILLIIIILLNFGFDSNISIFKNKINDKENKMITFIKNKDKDIYEINFGFNSIEINEKIILFLIKFIFH